MNTPTGKKCTVLLWLLLSVALISAAEWQDDSVEHRSKQSAKTLKETTVTLPELIDDSSEHFSSIDSANLDGLLERIGDSRLVLLGEATHGSAEFYDMRSRITRELIEKKGFNIIALEADWPDATSIDHFVRGTGHNPFQNAGHSSGFKNKPFSDFPTWMWANHSVLAFMHWLKNYNQTVNSAEQAVGFYGLDIYNMYASIEAVLDYLQDVDPKAAQAARWSYACLMPWADDPSLYSRDMQSGRYRGCAHEVTSVLHGLHNKRGIYTQTNTRLDRPDNRLANRETGQQRFFSAVQNARLVRNSERYFRTLFLDNNNSWNQRDQNMFDTLMVILNYRGQSSKAVVWSHNSHTGDARATEMNAHGQFNLGQRARETFADSAYLIGFGTDHGTVAAASEWGAPMKVMRVPPSHKDSYGSLFHDVETDNFLLPLRKSIMSKPVQDITRKKLLAKRLQRAIGTTYDPEDELKKHYSQVSLPRQFDEYIWFDETQAVKPLSRDTVKGVPDTFPFGL